jgi:endonuclease/exonuclease/phosphatase family metal-dependent hydrolase
LIIIFYNTSTISPTHSGVVHFYEAFTEISEARKISDHIPVWMEFEVK